MQVVWLIRPYYLILNRVFEANIELVLQGCSTLLGLCCQLLKTCCIARCRALLPKVLQVILCYYLFLKVPKYLSYTLTKSFYSLKVLNSILFHCYNILPILILELYIINQEGTNLIKSTSL